MKIAIASDHGGFDLKEAIIAHLKEGGYEVLDEGTYSHDSVDYPLFARKAADDVADGKAEFGIVCCTSAEGVCMTANKVKGIRCGIGYNDEVSEKLREHNNANMIAFAGGFMKPEEVMPRVDVFLKTPFAGGRHARRVEEMMMVEKEGR